MKSKSLLYCVIIIAFITINNAFAQNDSIKRRNNLHAMISINGLGLGYEINPINRIYLEAGATSWYYINRVYFESKFSLIEKRNLKLKLGADMSYIKTDFFSSFEILRVSPLLNFNYKQWGLQFALRETFWSINNGYPLFPGKYNRQSYIIIGITYNITMTIDSHRIRKYKKSRKQY